MNSTPLCEKRLAKAGPIIFALVLLANTAFGILDLMPDFIAYLILAKQFRAAADRAPYFEEARLAFRKLALITGLRLPVLILIAAQRSGDTYGFDIYAVASLSFFALETIFQLSAIKNLFEGLFRLGERTDASALIKDIRVTSDSNMATDTFRLLTYVSVIGRGLFATLPDMFRLTGTDSRGYQTTMSPAYPYVFISCHLIGLIIGVFWLVVAIKYITAIKREGRYTAALNAVAGEKYRERAEKKEFIGGLRSLITLFAISTLFTIDLKFDNFDHINILPHTVYAVILIVISLMLGKYLGRVYSLICAIPASLYAIVSVFYYVYETSFLYNEGYRSLVDKATTPTSYVTVEVFSVIETVFLIATLVAIAFSMHKLVVCHTGLLPTDENYSPSDRKYHKRLFISNYIILGLGILSALGKCVNVFSKAHFTIEFTIKKIAIIPTIEWIGLLSVALSAAYAIYTIYSASILKDEVEMKYLEEDM